VEASHEGGLTARSNMVCLYSHVVPQPSWINADYASITTEGKVSLSFHISSDGDSVQYCCTGRPPVVEKQRNSGSFHGLPEDTWKLWTHLPVPTGPGVMSLLR